MCCCNTLTRLRRRRVLVAESCSPLRTMVRQSGGRTAVRPRVWLSCAAIRATRPSHSLACPRKLSLASDLGGSQGCGSSDKLQPIAANRCRLRRTLRCSSQFRKTTPDSQATATPSTQLRIELRLHCSSLSIDSSFFITHLHTHHALHIANRAASSCNQAVHRQGRCARCLRMVERAAGSSSESNASRTTKPELC